MLEIMFPEDWLQLERLESVNYTLQIKDWTEKNMADVGSDDVRDSWTSRLIHCQETLSLCSETCRPAISHGFTECHTIFA